MDYLSTPLRKLVNPILRKKRPREQSSMKSPKIRINRSESLTTTRFFFPGSDEPTKTEEVITRLNTSTAKETIDEAKSRLKLIDDTILYASNKIHEFNPDFESVHNNNHEDEPRSLITKKNKLKIGDAVYAKQVDRFIKSISFPGSMHCASSSLYKYIKQYFFSEVSPKEYSKCLRASNLTSLLDFSYIFLPIQEIGWSLILIDNEREVLEFYSSDPEADYKISCEKVEKVMKDLEKVQNYDWEIIEVPEHTNLSDSGIFMLSFIKDLAENQKFSINSENVDEIRNQISTELNFLTSS